MRWIRKIGSAPISVVILIVVQLFCSLFFLTDVIMDYRTASPYTVEHVHLVIEAIASLALLAACIFEFRHLVSLSRNKQRLEQRLDIAKRAVHDVMEYHFDEWRLTSAERDVCMLVIKGFPISEIAGLRGSAEGTIKAHLNNIYRKSGTHGQAELLSVLIDALVGDFESATERKQDGLEQAIA